MMKKIRLLQNSVPTSNPFHSIFVTQNENYTLPLDRNLMPNHNADADATKQFRLSCRRQKQIRVNSTNFGM